MPDGLGPWIDLDAPALPGPSALPERCDVAVIGGGLAGVAAALFLAEAGVDVVLLEDLPDVGLARSGRTIGQVDTGLLEHPHRTISALGEEKASQLFRLGERNLDLLDERGLLDRCGSLWAALDQREPAEIETSAERLRALGFQAEVLDEAAVDKRTGGYNFGPGLLRPTGGRIEPGHAVRSLASAARNAGATLIGNAWVERIEDGPDGTEIVLEEHRLRADAVVIAAGFASGALEPALEGRITPVREQALMTAPVFAWYPTGGRAGHGYTTFRQLPDGHLVVSGCRWATPHLEVGEDDDTVLVERIQTKLDAFFRFHFPAAEESEVVERWAWVFDQTTDGLPFVGPLPGSPTRIALCGFGGNDAGLAVVCAREAVDGLLTGSNAIPRFMNPIRMVKWRGAS